MPKKIVKAPFEEYLYQDDPDRRGSRTSWGSLSGESEEKVSVIS